MNSVYGPDEWSNGRWNLTGVQREIYLLVSLSISRYLLLHFVLHMAFLQTIFSGGGQSSPVTLEDNQDSRAIYTFFWEWALFQFLIHFLAEELLFQSFIKFNSACLVSGLLFVNNSIKKKKREISSNIEHWRKKNRNKQWKNSDETEIFDWKFGTMGWASLTSNARAPFSLSPFASPGFKAALVLASVALQPSSG